MWLPTPHLDELGVVMVAREPPRGVVRILTLSTTEWQSKIHDAPSGTPNPPCPICLCKKKRSVSGGMSTVSIDILKRWINHGFLGQSGAMTVAHAPELRSLATKSSSKSQGELHQYCSLLHSASVKCKLSTASTVPSRHLALYSLKVMCYSLSLPLQNPLASIQSFNTAPQPKPLESQCR